MWGLMMAPSEAPGEGPILAPLEGLQGYPVEPFWRAVPKRGHNFFRSDFENQKV